MPSTARTALRTLSILNIKRLSYPKAFPALTKMSVPIVTWGASASYARTVRELLAPDYDVVHACTDVASALNELPALFSGDTAIRPSNGIGSNASLAEGEANRIPVVMAYGGGIDPGQKEQLREAMKAKANGASWADELKYVEVDRAEMFKRMNGGPPNPKISVELLVAALKKEGFGN